MNTCRLCGFTTARDDVCEDCAYDLNKRLNDWIAAPTLASDERTPAHGINRSH